MHRTKIIVSKLQIRFNYNILLDYNINVKIRKDYFIVLKYIVNIGILILSN